MLRELSLGSACSLGVILSFNDCPMNTQIGILGIFCSILTEEHGGSTRASQYLPLLVVYARFVKLAYDYRPYVPHITAPPVTSLTSTTVAVGSSCTTFHVYPLSRTRKQSSCFPSLAHERERSLCANSLPSFVASFECLFAASFMSHWARQCSIVR